MKKFIFVLLLLAATPDDSYADLGSFDFSQLGFGSSCSVKLDEEEDSRPTATIFSEAETQYAKGNYCKAAKLYAELKRKSPGEKIFHRAQFQIVMSLYQDKSFDACITEAKEYLLWYPSRPEAEEITITIARAFFQEKGTELTDMDWTTKAQQAFRDYLKAYPEGKYKAEAQEKMAVSYEVQAEKELKVARFYFKKEQYTAAALRVEYMASNFKGSKFVPEALALVSASYLALGKSQDAQVVLKVMQKSFPQSAWTRLAADNISRSRRGEDFDEIRAQILR